MKDAMILCAGLMLLATNALAANQNTFTPPKGCTAFLTVQDRNCQVEHHWACKGDPEGQVWRLVIDGEGPRQLSLTDNEFRWVLTYPLRAGTKETLVTPEADPASLTELLATGIDSYDFQIQIALDGRPLRRDRVVGFDKLTGNSVTIDGEPLLTTEFAYTISNDRDDSTYKAYGQQFVSERYNVFFGGVETSESGGSKENHDNSPVEFLKPGEKGFLSRNPKYDCGAVMSRFSTRPKTEQMEAPDDL